MDSIAELAHGEKSRTQSLNQSPSSSDAPGTEDFTLELENGTFESWYCLVQSRTLLIFRPVELTR